jgi:hypothetical protein
LCGDASGYRQIHVENAVYLIDYIYKDGLAPIPYEARDANCDETVNVGDAVYLINFIFKGDPPQTLYSICSGDANGNCSE